MAKESTITVTSTAECVVYNAKIPHYSAVPKFT